MSADFEALGRRAKACKDHWVWMVGMVRMDGALVVVSNPAESADETDSVRWTRRHGITDYLDVEPDDIPDLSHPPTLGGLLALVREAHGDDTIFMRYHDCAWWPHNACGLVVDDAFRDEAEALVATLEAAS